jgi:hypothetical protein
MPNALTFVQNLTSIDEVDWKNKKMVDCLGLFTCLLHMQAYIHPDILPLDRLAVRDVFRVTGIEIKVLEDHDASPHFAGTMTTKFLTSLPSSNPRSSIRSGI